MQLGYQFVIFKKTIERKLILLWLRPAYALQAPWYLKRIKYSFYFAVQVPRIAVYYLGLIGAKNENVETASQRKFLSHQGDTIKPGNAPILSEATYAPRNTLFFGTAVRSHFGSLPRGILTEILFDSPQIPQL